MRRRTALSIRSASLCCLVSLAAGQSTTRVSLSSTGVQSAADCYDAAISDDGDVVVFSSSAANLVAGDTNALRDVFVRVRSTGTTTRVSVSSAGAQSNGQSGVYWGPGITADGRWIAFDSAGSNLVTGDTNGSEDVFLHDRTTSQTSRVSLSSSGAQGNQSSTFAGIAPSGRWILFDSLATNLVTGDTNGLTDTFVRDLQTGTTVRVSVTDSGGQPNIGTDGESISGDGRWVTFVSQATNVVAGDTNSTYDVFLRDLVNGVTTRASVANGGAQPNNSSYQSSLSADGRYIAFASYASNLVSGDTNGTWDVFLRDRVANTTRRISLYPGGVQSGGASAGPRFSANSRYITFWSWASLGVVGDSNNEIDVFLHDVVTGENKCMSVVNSLPGSTGNDTSVWGAVSGSGRYVAFESRAVNLVTGDTNHVQDIFVRDWVACGMLTAADCNLNGTHDLCDIEAGTSEDLDYDGYPDECETPACQLEWIRASDAAANDRFGQYLDTDGASVVVGAPNDDGAAGADQGSAWVFARTGTHFQVEWKLLANDAAADDHLGSSIEVRGDWAVVGAPGNDASGSGAGAAYLFKRVGPGLWSQAAKFYGSNTNAADAFGSVLEWNDELLFVSATTKETPLGADRGAVYVFRWNGTAFNELAQIHAPDGLAGDRFGSELDYENGRLAVGAAFADTPSGVDSGAAYVFRQSGSAWTFEQKLPGRAAGSLAGRSLSLEDAWLAVGQPEDGFAGTYAGLVQVWHRDALTNVWSLDSDLRGPDTNDYDFFGYAVQYVGTRLLVGAPFRSWNPAHAAGEVYVFNRAGSAWLDTQRMRPEFPSDNLTYGYSVCHANGVLAIGASADDAFGPADTGSAYVYGTLGDDCNLNGRCDLCDIRDLSVPDTNGDGLSDACEYSQLCTCPPNLGPCGNHDASAGCANSSGAGALITPAGSTSVSSDDLVLTTSGLPVNKSSIMFMSGNFTAIPLPFSDGRRCVAAPLLRWPTTNSGASGSVAYGPGLAAQSATLFGPAGSILAGSTWGFQTWYRDPSGPCGLLTNISAAVKATFLP